MKMLICCLTLLLMSCGASTKDNMTVKVKDKVAMRILHEAHKAHGGDNYERKTFQFSFRQKTYSFRFDKEQFVYTIDFAKDGIQIHDVLNNEGFKRSHDDALIILTDKDKSTFSNSLNSVVYFATLPHKLFDPAVLIEYVGEASIKNKLYDVLEIKFQEENGGKDHDDEFHYWINKDTYQIDFLAYNYRVNKGGVRFRSAYNKRMIDGVLFQDYENYKAEVGTPLIELPSLYEEGKLEKLSLIETENVLSLN